jgi:hypothetical protein
MRQLSCVVTLFTVGMVASDAAVPVPVINRRAPLSAVSIPGMPPIATASGVGCGETIDLT